MSWGMSLYVRSDHYHNKFEDSRNVDDDGEHQTFSTELILYEALMLIVQVVMLNLLIAILSDSYTRKRASFKLEAQFQRAKVIKDYELYTRFFRNRICRSRTLKRSTLFPRWLHICIPEAELSEDRSADATAHILASSSGSSSGAGSSVVALGGGSAAASPGGGGVGGGGGLGGGGGRGAGGSGGGGGDDGASSVVLERRIDDALGLVRQTSADLRTQAERQHKSMALHVLSLKATLRNMSASIGTVAADDEPPPPPVHELHRTVSELSGSSRTSRASCATPAGSREERGAPAGSRRRSCRCPSGRRRRQ